jgi:hypothetical protein
MTLKTKAVWLLAVAALSVSLQATAAWAEDDESDSDSDSKSSVVEDHKSPESKNEVENETHSETGLHTEHNELHDKYGDVDQVNLPPLVVKEQKPGQLVTKQSIQENSTLTDAENANPVANMPIEPEQIRPQSATPAETFFQSATVGLGAMGAGAAALGALAIRRSVRARKDSNSTIEF